MGRCPRQGSRAAPVSADKVRLTEDRNRLQGQRDAARKEAIALRKDVEAMREQVPPHRIGSKLAWLFTGKR
jgi:hypothetical protein